MVPSTLPSGDPSLSYEPSRSLEVDLGGAENFVILAKTGITNVPSSIITGNIGVSPIAATAITGFTLIMDSTNKFSKDTQVTGNVYAASYFVPTPATLTSAVLDMQTAHAQVAGFAPTYMNVGGGQLGGAILGPGVHTFTTDILISTGDLIFNGTAEDIFIIQTSKKVTQAANINVVLKGGALAKNIFWSIAESITIGTGSHIEGILLVKAAVIFTTGSSLNGRILTQTAVTLQKAVISELPLSVPSLLPSSLPSLVPSSLPSPIPSSDPSGLHSSIPSSGPSAVPSSGSSAIPSGSPTTRPSTLPTSSPTGRPSISPTSFVCTVSPAILIGGSCATKSCTQSSGLSCYCDDLCYKYQDCCSDICLFCPNSIQFLVLP
jgi:hypothetical protein